VVILVASGALVAPAYAQEVVCNGQTGQIALLCVKSDYAPTSTLGYGPARDILYSQIDTDASGQLVGIYSGFAITLNPSEDPSQDAYSKGINAEHVFPQSKGAGNAPQRSDMHNLYPARIEVNSARSNIPFGESPDTQTDGWYYLDQNRSSLPPANIDLYSERNGNSAWEPRESKKGDIARAVFYFFAVYPGPADESFFESMKDQLLAWHEDDPVTSGERARSTAIANQQGNENPFVLDETLAGRAFGSAEEGPALGFDPVTHSVSEGDGAVTLTVRYNNPDGTDVTADVVFQSTTSSATEDDIAGFSQQTLSFPASAPNGTTQSVTVSLTDDSEAEGTEEAIFQLANLSTTGTAEIGPNGTAVVTIRDNENVIVLTEVLADPAPGLDGDANQDGTRSATDDEFIELYNTSDANTIDLSGYEYVDDGVGTRHVFPDGTVLEPGSSIVVFGGGTPSGSIPGLVQVASTGTLGLNNGGDSFTILDATGNAPITYSYDGSVEDESMTRAFPFTGDFVPHSTASGAGGALFSPGRDLSGDPLPVELTAFDARFSDAAVHLAWETASETNNAGFYIERRSQGASWEDLEFVPGAGTTGRPQTYRFTDQALPYSNDALTYRLRQVDTDGTATHSAPVTVDRRAVTRLHLAPAYPNPTSRVATVRYATPQNAQGAHLALYDALGRRVRTIEVQAGGAGGRHALQLDLNGLATGTYFMRLTAGGQVRTQPVTIVR